MMGGSVRVQVAPLSTRSIDSEAQANPELAVAASRRNSSQQDELDLRRVDHQCPCWTRDPSWVVDSLDTAAAVDYFGGTFCGLCAMPCFVYREGLRGWWDGRFISTFYPGVSWAALSLGGGVCVAFFWMPVELLLLLTVYTYTSLVLSVSYGYLSLPNRLRFLAFKAAQLARARTAAVDPISEAEAVARVQLRRKMVTVARPGLLVVAHDSGLLDGVLASRGGGDEGEDDEEGPRPDVEVKNDALVRSTAEVSLSEAFARVLVAEWRRVVAHDSPARHHAVTNLEPTRARVTRLANHVIHHRSTPPDAADASQTPSWSVDARVLCEEIISRASTGASISLFSYRLSFGLSAVAALIPLITFFLDAPSVRGVPLAPRIVVFLASGVGLLPSMAVTMRYFLRVVQNARKKSILWRAVRDLIDDRRSLLRLLPFVDLCDPKNMVAWSALVEVVSNFERYNAVTAQTTTNAMLAIATLTLFACILALVLLVAGVGAVEFATLLLLLYISAVLAAVVLVTLLFEAEANDAIESTQALLGAARFRCSAEREDAQASEDQQVGDRREKDKALQLARELIEDKAAQLQIGSYRSRLLGVVINYTLLRSVFVTVFGTVLSLLAFAIDFVRGLAMTLPTPGGF